VVYKFSCAGCPVCYVGETTPYFSTRVREHLKMDRASHIFKHIESSKACRSACSLASYAEKSNTTPLKTTAWEATCSLDNFTIIDQASSRFALKIKEALYIL